MSWIDRLEERADERRRLRDATDAHRAAGLRHAASTAGLEVTAATDTVRHLATGDGELAAIMARADKLAASLAALGRGDVDEANRLIDEVHASRSTSIDDIIGGES